MTIFSHSGNLGDIVWSLPTVKYYGPGEFNVILGGVPDAIRKYNNGPVFPEYNDRLSQKDYDLIAPLLESQSYITKVSPAKKCNRGDFDLDKFRGTVGQEFKTNFIETFAQTFKMPYDVNQSFSPWLEVSPNHKSKIVLTRTLRYRSNRTSAIPQWIKMIRDYDLRNNGLFVGLPEEYEDFQSLFNIRLPFYKCSDFLDLAQVIAGADLFISNQTFAYSVAVGLGKNTILETLSWRPLVSNECYIPKEGCYYF